MYCKFNMFTMQSPVVIIDADKQHDGFIGGLDDVCNYMAAEYQTHNYEKIVLAGPYANAVAERIKTYSKINYNFDEINIEVIE